MNIAVEDLRRLVASFIDAGIQAYTSSLDPTRDRLKQAEARKYITRLGFPPVMLSRWVAAGLLHPVKEGEGNSAVWYSITEIKSAICAIQFKQLEHDGRRMDAEDRRAQSAARMAVVAQRVRHVDKSKTKEKGDKK